MQIPLLQTKLHIPGPSTGFVSRPQLLDKLRKGLDHGLTVVAAPAGFGKTTLILEWIRVANLQVAWVSLDSGDNDPNRFWTYFIAALQRRQPYLGENALEFLRVQSTEALAGQAMLDSLINDLAALNEDWVVVLDDYHEVETPAIHEGMVYLLDHLPPLFHLLLITRSDPPFPLARWRVSGQLAEIRAHDLRFTTLEAAAFLNQTLGLSLSEQDIAALAERTEGWIAGLQLAALSMQGQQNFHDFIHTFSGSNRYVVDYLIEEVFNQQPAEIQSFLLQTSVLARMSAPLCNAMLENSRLNSQAILEQLERDNLFVIALDPDRQWYRYHQLFAESLRNRLRKIPLDDLAVGVAELHQRASDWFEQNELVEEAIQHALLARDFVRSLRLITQAAPFLFPQAGFKTLSDWVDQLPTDQVGANHELMTYLAWMWLLTGQSEKLKTFISTTRTMQDEQASPGSRGRLLGLQAMLALLNEQTPESLAFGREALSLLKSEDFFIRGIVLANLSRAQIYAGEMEGAVRTLKEAIDLSERNGLRLGAVTLLVSLAMEVDLMGHRREAVTFCQRALTLARDTRGRLSFIATTPYIGLSWLAYEANELEEARASILQAETFLKLVDLYPARHAVLQMRFLLHLAQGEQEAVRQVIQEARQFAQQIELTSYLSVWASLEAEWHLRAGNLMHVREWINTIDVPAAATKAISFVIPQRDTTFFTYIHLLLAEKNWEAAHLLLTDLENLAQEKKRNGPLISLFLMHAHVKWEQGEPGQAIHFLERAVKIAAPEGIIRPFLDEAGPQMAALPRVHLVAPAFVEGILSALGEISAPGLPPSIADQVPLPESLSEREFEVLQLIAEGYSNQEIAQKLVVAVSTVKKHINSIFGKLGVTHRAQAIAQARELGIL